MDRDWFSWADLVVVLAAGGMWYLGLTWQPLLVALSPWLIRVASGRFPFRRTPFDVPLILFLVSAAVGVWASHDPAAAWSKFWLIVGAVLLFYALSGQPQRNLWPIVGFLGFIGIIIGAFFLLTHDWQAFPAKITILNRELLRWSVIRPTLEFSPLPQNVAASLMAISLPFLIVSGVHAWHKKQLLMLVAVVIAILFVTTLLFVATSRGALVALGFASGLYFLIWVSHPLAGRAHLPRFVTIALLLGALITVSAVVVMFYPGGPIALLDILPGPSSATSRAELSRQTIDLIKDFRITGAGLESFPGLYSQYILVIPYFFLPNGHNIFLDAALEQGPIGLISMTIIFLGSFILLATGSRLMVKGIRHNSDWTSLRWALAAGMLIMIIHGLVEDTIYGSRAILALFTLPGLTVAASLPVRETNAKILSRINLLSAGATLLLVLILGLVWFRSTNQSAGAIFQANLGAIRMAKVELRGFPSGKWSEIDILPALVPAEDLFNQTLDKLENRTARHRLGLIALLRQDFEQAIEHLEAANSQGDIHRGIRKNLAYSYVWAGRSEESVSFLSEIPEARNEMEAYSWWWGTQGRSDLADSAYQSAMMLLSSR